MGHMKYVNLRHTDSLLDDSTNVNVVYSPCAASSQVTEWVSLVGVRELPQSVCDCRGYSKAPAT